MCLYKNWRYVSLGGAGNVVQAFYPINNLVFGDRENNTHPNAALLKIKLNKYFYNEEPIGIQCGGGRLPEPKDPILAHAQRSARTAFNDLKEDHINIVKDKILCYL